MKKEIIDIINDRLILVNHLNKVENHFKGRFYKRQSNPYEVEYPLYRNYYGLKVYLLLTCFDILGQPEEWLDFSSWLNCKKPNIIKERDFIFNNTKLENQVQYINEIQKQYNKRYGVKNSFYSFVNEVLSNENRLKLFDSISNMEIVSELKVYEDGSHSPPSGKGIEINNELKLKFLFQLRNSFTHKGIVYGTDIGAVFDLNSHEVIDDKEFYFSYQIHKEKLKGKEITWSVKRWPYVLSEMIEETMNNKIQAFG